MLSRRTSKLALISAATALTLVLSVGVQNAEARDGARAHSAQRAAPAKRPARPNVPRGDRTVHTERQRTENGHSSHSVVTGSNGQTATRDATVVNDRDAGTRTRDVTYTGPNGGVSTVTGPNGHVGAREVTVNCDKAAGKCTKDVTVDGGRDDGN